VVAVGLLLSGCAPGGNLPVLTYTNASYTLGAGDQVRIITFGEDQLTGVFKLDDQGDIAMPLIGTVKSVGLTTSRLAAQIAAELRRRKLLSDPSVAVEVAAYRPVFVLGEVVKPGEYPYQPGMTMLTTIAVAGGFTYRAFQPYVSVVRTTGDQPVQGRITPLSYVAPGDVITVYERHF
jgi:polysaccharide export outer membrane protein